MRKIDEKTRRALKNAALATLGAVLALGIVIYVLSLFEAPWWLSCKRFGIETGVGSEYDRYVRAASSRMVDEGQLWKTTGQVSSMMALDRQYSVYFGVLSGAQCTTAVPTSLVTYVQMRGGHGENRDFVRTKLATMVARDLAYYKANGDLGVGISRVANVQLEWVIRDEASGDILRRFQLLDQNGDGEWDLVSCDATRRPIAKDRFASLVYTGDEKYNRPSVSNYAWIAEPQFDYDNAMELPQDWSGDLVDIEAMF